LEAGFSLTMLLPAAGILIIAAIVITVLLIKSKK